MIILGTKKIRCNRNMKCFTEKRQLLFTSHVDLKEYACVQRIVVPLKTTNAITWRNVMLKTKNKTFFNHTLDGHSIAFLAKNYFWYQKVISDKTDRESAMIESPLTFTTTCQLQFVHKLDVFCPAFLGKIATSELLSCENIFSSYRICFFACHLQKYTIIFP